MTTPRVSATMLSARKHVEGRRGMPGMIPREARRLGVDERGRLTGLLRAQVPDGLGKAGGEPDACPRCGGTHLVRKGHDRDGSQRWARGSCRRTLSRKTMGLLGCPEPEEDVWASYAGHACAGGTLRGCAGACGVCPGTSWLVRMRLCEVMGRALAPSGSGPTVSCQVDGTYLDESPAGRRPGSAAGMPREPRRSAAPCASAAYRTPRRAWPAGGDLGDEFCEVADRGRPTDEAHGPGPGGRGRGSVRLDRRPPGVRPGAPRACVSRHDATPAREAVRGELGMADATRARPEGFLARFRGGPAGEARPLPRLVPVGRADEEVGRRQGGHPVGPGGDGELRQHAVRPREGAAAVLVLLGG